MHVVKTLQLIDLQMIINARFFCNYNILKIKPLAYFLETRLHFCLQKK